MNCQESPTWYETVTDIPSEGSAQACCPCAEVVVEVREVRAAEVTVARWGVWGFTVLGVPSLNRFKIRRHWQRKRGSTPPFNYTIVEGVETFDFFPANDTTSGTITQLSTLGAMTAQSIAENEWSRTWTIDPPGATPPYIDLEYKITLEDAVTNAEMRDWRDSGMSAVGVVLASLIGDAIYGQARDSNAISGPARLAAFQTAIDEREEDLVGDGTLEFPGLIAEMEEAFQECESVKSDLALLKGDWLEKRMEVCGRTEDRDLFCRAAGYYFRQGLAGAEDLQEFCDQGTLEVLEAQSELVAIGEDIRQLECDPDPWAIMLAVLEMQQEIASYQALKGWAEGYVNATPTVWHADLSGGILRSEPPAAHHFITEDDDEHITGLAKRTCTVRLRAFFANEEFRLREPLASTPISFEIKYGIWACPANPLTAIEYTDDELFALGLERELLETREERVTFEDFEAGIVGVVLGENFDLTPRESNTEIVRLGSVEPGPQYAFNCYPDGRGIFMRKRGFAAYTTAPGAPVKVYRRETATGGFDGCPDTGAPSKIYNGSQIVGGAFTLSHDVTDWLPSRHSRRIDGTTSITNLDVNPTLLEEALIIWDQTVNCGGILLQDTMELELENEFTTAELVATVNDEFDRLIDNEELESEDVTFFTNAAWGANFLSPDETFYIRSELKIYAGGVPGHSGQLKWTEITTNWETGEAEVTERAQTVGFGAVGDPDEGSGMINIPIPGQCQVTIKDLRLVGTHQHPDRTDTFTIRRVPPGG